MQNRRTQHATSCPRVANFSRMFLVFMYCDPPVVWKPAIRAEKAELISSVRAKSAKKA